MNLAIDIGNTNTCIAVFKGNKIVRRFSQTTNSPPANLINNLRKYEIRHIGISSVVPTKTLKWRNILLNNFKADALIISNKTKLPINIKLNNTQTLGADRICNAVFGHSYFNPPRNVIVISLGTANTYDVILSNGDYIGGMISPGLSMLADSLRRNTALLPLVDIGELKKPVQLIGKNTVSAIRSGIIHSVVFTIKEFIIRTGKIYGKKFNVILTGRNSEILRSKLGENIYYLPDSVLYGINTILNYNIKDEITNS